MKTHTDNILPTYQILGPTLRINFDEQSAVVDHMGQTHTAYEYQIAVVELGTSRSTIIEAIIACKYSTGREVATINNAAADPKAYDQYQMFRVQAKELANGWFALQAAEREKIEAAIAEVAQKQAELDAAKAAAPVDVAA